MNLLGHPPELVAEYLRQKAEAEGNPLTPMQLIKLVYLCHGWMLGLYGRPMINESVEAWQYGPVIRSVYHKIKQFRSNPVTQPIVKAFSDNSFDDAEKDILNQVYAIYGSYSGLALSRLTHADGTPWSDTWEKSGQNSDISNDLIQDHFSNLYQKYSQQANNGR